MIADYFAERSLTTLNKDNRLIFTNAKTNKQGPNNRLANLHFQTRQSIDRFADVKRFTFRPMDDLAKRFGHFRPATFIGTLFVYSRIALAMAPEQWTTKSREPLPSTVILGLLPFVS
jgi:hypothetical protein